MHYITHATTQNILHASKRFKQTCLGDHMLNALNWIYFNITLLMINLIYQTVFKSTANLGARCVFNLKFLRTNHIKSNVKEKSIVKSMFDPCIWIPKLLIILINFFFYPFKGMIFKIILNNIMKSKRYIFLHKFLGNERHISILRISDCGVNKK